MINAVKTYVFNKCSLYIYVHYGRGLIAETNIKIKINLTFFHELVFFLEDFFSLVSLSSFCCSLQDISSSVSSAKSN